MTIPCPPGHSRTILHPKTLCHVRHTHGFQGSGSGTVGPSFCHWPVPTSSAWKADAVPLCPYGAAPACLLPSTAGPGHSPLFPPTAVGHHVLPATRTDCSAPCLCPPPAVSVPPSSPPLATFPSPCTGPEGACCKALCFLQQWWPNYFGIWVEGPVF